MSVCRPIYVCTYMRTFVCMYAGMYVCMYQCVCIYIWILSNMHYNICDLLKFPSNVLHRTDGASALKFTD
jgi:hypothetical protein